jgi:hypothetical protein
MQKNAGVGECGAVAFLGARSGRSEANLMVVINACLPVSFGDGFFVGGHCCLPPSLFPCPGEEHGFNDPRVPVLATCPCFMMPEWNSLLRCSWCWLFFPFVVVGHLDFFFSSLDLIYYTIL